MNIKSAEFVTSAVKPSQYPPPARPEIAFAGRSNVGKSSLINALLGRKNLVKTGSTPGRTQTINFFLINDGFYFVDLPGYGYAKVPRAVRKTWGPMVERYLKTRRAGESSGPEANQGLCAVVVILDIRRLPNQGDHDLLAWLTHYKIPALVVLTKADKLKKNKQDKQRNSIAHELSTDPSALILFSATTGVGKQQLWKAIAECGMKIPNPNSAIRNPQSAMIIDGSHGEGGGQILRTALALAGILRQPVEIHNVRGGRKKPGLRPQHLMAVKGMALITEGKVEGAEPGSMGLYFEPRRVVPGSYSLDVGTAGSTSLVLHTMIPALLFAKRASQVVITGGTHAPWSPCFHYLKEVFAPALQQMGGALRVDMERWGWYPRGGGKVIASISPIQELSGVDLTWQGKLQDTYVLSAVSNLSMSIAERQRDQVLKRLRDHGYEVPRIELLKGPSPGTGTVVFVRATFENGVAGFTSLGKRGKPAEEVADDACSDFLRFMASGAAVDDHLADQLVLYMALAKGRSSLITGRITKHLVTNMWVIEQFLPVRFEVDEETGRVSVEGIGFSA